MFQDSDVTPARRAVTSDALAKFKSRVDWYRRGGLSEYGTFRVDKSQIVCPRKKTFELEHWKMIHPLVSTGSLSIPIDAQ